MRAIRLKVMTGVLLSIVVVSQAQTPLEPRFTYQGVLEEDDAPFNGVVHLLFSLWDAEAEGNRIGAFQPLTDIPVANGQFNVTLNAGGEFGPEAFNGDARWLQIEVCADAGCDSTVTLSHKENIEPLEDEFERLLDAQPMTYTRPGKPDRPEIGYIAEEIEELGLTRLLQYDKEGRPEGVNYEKAVLYLTEIAKAQRDRIAAQEERIASLESRLSEQISKTTQEEARFDDLTKRILQLEASQSELKVSSAPDWNLK